VLEHKLPSVGKRETFGKYSFLFKFKSKIPDFDRGKAKILTTDIHYVFRGLQFETDAEIGQKGAFCKGLGDMRRHGPFSPYWDSNAFALDTR